MNLDWINSLSEAEAKSAFLQCCGSPQWAEQMAKSRHFTTEASLFSYAERIWRNLSREEWLEAFAAHPKIGDPQSLRAKYGQSATWSAGEQAGVSGASEEVLESLAVGNRLYEEKFGHIFIVFATGKTADQVLELLHQRLKNDPEKEICLAALEQEKITRLRLEKS
jgi:OHCU decarboxylase